MFGPETDIEKIIKDIGFANEPKNKRELNLSVILSY
jgi:hypothetical protein